MDDLRETRREAMGKDPQPSAVILDGQTVHGTIESGHRGGYDGHKKKKGSKVHMSVDTLGNLLSIVVTSANESEGEQVEELCRQVQEITGDSVGIASADQGYTGEDA